MVEVMEIIKLNDEIYDELYIFTKAEVKEDLYFEKSLFDKKIMCGFLPGKGTALGFENMHFLIVNEKHVTKKYAIWHNHKVIGYCNIPKDTAEKANKASNAIFYFGFDENTK